MKTWEKILLTLLGVFLIFTEVGAPVGLALIAAVWL